MTFKKKYHNWGEGKVSYIEWDKDSSMPGLQFCHATGFNALTYKKLLEPLANSFHIRAEDARGHGFTEISAVPNAIYDWKIYRDDLILSVESFVEKKGEAVILGGHSMGGASVMQVAAERPDLVSGIVLVEPVLISELSLNILKLARKFPATKFIPMIKEMTSRSDSTLKRRVEFPNKEMILKSYKGRGAFSTWNKGFLEDYIQGGTKSYKDKIKLTCDPRWEAATFASWKHNAMNSIKKISCPIVLLQGEVGSTTRDIGVKLLKKKDPEGVFKVIKNSSHFLPMEFPEIIQEEVINLNSRIKSSL